MSENEWTPEQPIVSLTDVHKSFGDLKVLKGISFDVMKGEVICIIGPSGSGKSTLIRCINALNDINSGSIRVHGEESSPSRGEAEKVNARRVRIHHGESRRNRPRGQVLLHRASLQGQFRRGLVAHHHRPVEGSGRVPGQVARVDGS